MYMSVVVDHLPISATVVHLMYVPLLIRTIKLMNSWYGQAEQK
jgi:hypothetical protein